MESESDRSRYKTASEINKEVEKRLIEEIEKGELSVKKLSSIGNDLIKQQLECVYKREKTKFIGFPVSISIGNCVGNYIYEPNNDEYNVIKENDVFKIQFGVNIAGCISMYGNTFVYKNNKVSIAETNDLFIKLKKICEKTMFATETNDTLRQHLEIECSKYGYRPLENNVSYQGDKSELSHSDSKYIVLNHQKRTDIDGNILSHPNECFEFEENEVYHINLQLVKDETCLDTIQRHNSHIYRFNEYYHNFKTKSGKDFYNVVKKECDSNAFVYADFDNNSFSKMGKRECINGGILDEFPVYYLKQKNDVVYSLCFTVLIGKQKGYIQIFD